MPDTVLGIYFLALSADAVAWYLAYRWIYRRLGDRHPARFSRLFGTELRRKNGMDKFFALLGFLFEDQAELRDGRLLATCVFLKLSSVLFVVVFIAMMFTPFFLHLNESR
jgi:hypothetical protein